jgi:hypothetical protein
MLGAPEEAARIGQAARQFIEKEANLDLFVDRIIQGVQRGHALAASRLAGTGQSSDSFVSR